MQRDETIIVRITKQEKKIILDKLKISRDKTLSDFVRKSLLNKEINVMDINVIKERNYEINKIGNNINQIAKKVNTINEFYYEDFKLLVNEFNKLITQNKIINDVIINLIKGD